MDGRDLVAEGGPQGIEGCRGIGVLPIRLVDEEAGGRAGCAAQVDGGLEPRPDHPAGIDHEQGTVAGGHRRHSLGNEIRVARGIDHGHDRAVVVEGGDREAERLAALLLFGFVVEGGRPIVDPAKTRDGPDPKQEALGQGCLACTGVAGQHDTPKMSQVNALRRHQAGPPRLAELSVWP